MPSMPRPLQLPEGPLNVYFDVDHTLVHADQHKNHLRPGAHHALERLFVSGHSIYIWSAGGQAYCEKTVELHGLGEWVSGCFDKHPKVDPTPHFIIDDDWYLVEKYGGFLVSQYKAHDPADTEFLDILEALQELGAL